MCSDEDGPIDPNEVEDPNGEWVSWGDHEAALSQATCPVKWQPASEECPEDGGWWCEAPLSDHRWVINISHGRVIAGKTPAVEWGQYKKFVERIAGPLRPPEG